MKFKLLLTYLSKMSIYKSIPVYNMNWLLSSKFYKNLLLDSRITLVDVGARGGSVDELKPLEPYINYIGFDADGEEIDRLKSIPTSYDKTRYISSFVSEKKETVKYNLHHVAGNSSVYDYSKEFTNWFIEKDIDLVKEVLQLEANSLDNLIKEDIDVIKLDTQGNEYEILKGANRSLTSALVVECEVEFMQMYSGQKLAHNVMSKMYELGFDLIFLNRVFGKSKSFKGESRGQVVFGDALFGLSREKALKLDIEKQKKYCALLINYGLYDFAYDIFLGSPELQNRCPILVTFFKNVNKKQAKIIRLFKFILDKLIFTLLVLRKTNGISYDSDRSWPIR